MCGSRYATAFFITSALCSTNGSCICPEPNSSPTIFMPEQMIVDDLQRRVLLQRLVEMLLQVALLAVDDVALQHLLEGADPPSRRSRGRLDRLVREQADEVQQRVEALASPVVDQVERARPTARQGCDCAAGSATRARIAAVRPALPAPRAGTRCSAPGGPLASGRS